MAISEARLKEWTAAGDTAASSVAYASVKEAIEDHDALSNRYVDVYLQGSYRNSTNTLGDSDVDVVVHSRASYMYDVSALPEPERAETLAAIEPADYAWPSFRGDVLDALISEYGSSGVIDRNKCITIVDPERSGISADIVPAFDHVTYLPGGTVVRGIALRTQRDNLKIVSYPKQHYDCGVEKQKATTDDYKPSVRMFKNARSAAVDQGYLDTDVTPSYFIECMLYNAPNQDFKAPSCEDVFVGVFNSINSAPWNTFTCANGIIPLFGSGTSQWQIEKARALWNGLKDLWNG